MIRHPAALVLCLLFVSSSLTAFAGVSQIVPVAEQVERAMVSGEIPAVEVAEHPEEFRAQLLDFLRDTDDALSVALAHPAIGPRLAEQIEARGATIPLPPETYRIIEEADWDALIPLREGFVAVPGALAAPALLREGVRRLPAPTDPVFATTADRATCSDVYTEFNKLPALTESQRGVTIGRNILALLHDVYSLIVAVLNSEVTTCESPLDIPLAFAQIPAIIVKGVVDVIDLALAFTLDELGFQMVDADRCINLTTCPPHGFTERFRPDDTPTLAGRGCDDRDNNCTGGIDEILEDRFGPTVSIDAALTAQCYADPGSAEAAARLAVRAADDCVALAEAPQAHEGTLNVTFNRSACVGALMATATDKNGNTAGASAAVVVDDVAPQITLQDLSGTCQPDVETARNAFGFMTSDTCTAVQSDIRIVEKECVADFEFDAVDACGNRTTELRSVRLDASAPDVDIEQLLLPDVDGRFCFAGEAGAVAEVAEATTIDDNCTDRADLSFSTTAVPTGDNACDRLVTSTATDSCSLATSDSIVARLDSTAPAVTCSVTQPILWPADSTMRDVGFSMTVEDDCGMQDVTVDVKITSDEPTSLDLSVQGATDLVPDARIVPDGLGGILGIELRSERHQTQNADGRVYRIRVTATDGCGNSSYDDCFVSVPKSLSNNRSELVNSGQNFDATVAN